MTDSNTSSLLVFLMIFLFIYSLIGGGMMYVFSTGYDEPDSTNTNLPPEPSGDAWWDTLGYIGTLATFLIGIATGFSTYGVPSPLNWIFSGVFWVVVAAVVALMVRG